MAIIWYHLKEELLLSHVINYILIKVAPYIFNSLESLSFTGVIEPLCNN